MGRQRHICAQTTPWIFQRKSVLCSGLGLADGTNTAVCSEVSVSFCQETPKSQRHLGMGAEMMGGEETDHNITKHLVRSCRWIIALSLYPALERLSHYNCN